MTNVNLHDRANPRKEIIIARGRLKEAKCWLDHPRRRVRPKSRRGHSILGWVADHARLAYPGDPEAAVRRRCREFAPELTEPELDELVIQSQTANKAWTHDHSAMVLGISFDDQPASFFRFLGCDDDLNYDRRRDREKSKGKVYSRTYRAKNGASTKRGRPALNLSEADVAERKALDAERKRAERSKDSSGRPRGRPKKCVQNNSSGHKIINIKSDELIRTEFQDGTLHDRPLLSRAPEAPRRLEPIMRQQILDGEIVVDRGVAWAPPPTSHLARAIARARVLQAGVQ